MKRIIPLVIILFAFIDIANAQITDKLQLDEAARVDVQRSIVSKELTQLRDSIGFSIKVVEILSGKAKIVSQKTEYENVKASLLEYQKRVKSDLEETSLTARNAWTGESEKRIMISTNDTRREYNRIRNAILK